MYVRMYVCTYVCTYVCMSGTRTQLIQEMNGDFSLDGCTAILHTGMRLFNLVWLAP